MELTTEQNWLIEHDCYIHCSEHTYYVLPRRTSKASVVMALGKGATPEEALYNAYRKDTGNE